MLKQQSDLLPDMDYRYLNLDDELFHGKLEQLQASFDGVADVVEVEIEHKESKHCVIAMGVNATQKQAIESCTKLTDFKIVD